MNLERQEAFFTAQVGLREEAQGQQNGENGPLPPRRGPKGVLSQSLPLGLPTATCPLTERQKCEPVPGHGELIEAGQLAEVARHTPQPVPVHGEVLQRKAQVKPLG